MKKKKHAKNSEADLESQTLSKESDWEKIGKFELPELKLMLTKKLKTEVGVGSLSRKKNQGPDLVVVDE